MEFFLPGVVQAERINRLHKYLQEFISVESTHLIKENQGTSRYLPNLDG